MVTRIGLMLPGAVSLGAYEGGALAALLTAVQASEGELVVDAIASASAGSVTGLVAARCLLCGDKPVDAMRKTWVDLPSLQNLERDLGPDAPLSMEGLIDTARQILGAEIDESARASAQKEPVTLSMSLTALGGLTYSLIQSPPSANVVEPLQATTFVDYYAASLGPRSTVDDFTSHIEGALASGSTPVGFLPRRLNRSNEIDEYKANGIITPTDGSFEPWYSDGGDLDNQPLGRLLDLIAQIDNASGTSPNWDRAMVVLNIEPGGPPAFTGTWFGPDTPTWLSTLLHVDHIRSTQSLYDDLKTLEKTNQRIAWITKVAATLEGKLGDDEFQSLAADIADRRDTIAQQTRAASRAPAPSAVTPATSMEDLLRQAAGLQDKRQIPVHVISPEVDPHVTLSPERQISGEFFFHFGGFFDVKFRESDFSLGFHNAQYWLQQWLPGRIAGSGEALEAVDAVFKSLPWGPIDEGDASVASLPIIEKLEAVKLLGHIERVVAHDIGQDVFGRLDAGGTGAPDAATSAHASIKEIVGRHLESLRHAISRVT